MFLKESRIFFWLAIRKIVSYCKQKGRAVTCGFCFEGGGASAPPLRHHHKIGFSRGGSDVYLARKSFVR